MHFLHTSASWIGLLYLHMGHSIKLGVSRNWPSGFMPAWGLYLGKHYGCANAVQNKWGETLSVPFSLSELWMSDRGILWTMGFFLSCARKWWSVKRASVNIAHASLCSEWKKNQFVEAQTRNTRFVTYSWCECGPNWIIQSLHWEKSNISQISSLQIMPKLQ